MKQRKRLQGPGRGRVSLSTCVLLVGVLLMVAGGTAYLSRYPWRQHLYRWGWVEVPADLPDPAPLPVQLLSLEEGRQEPVGLELADFPVPAGREAALPSLAMTRLGSVKLPVLGVSENIVEGAGDEMLYAVGHVPGSAPMGGEGNCVLSAHRNYVNMNPFRHLDKMGEGDRVLLQDDEARYTYEVFRSFEVEPTEQWVMDPWEGESYMLTLVTCTPVVNPTRRLIVWCRLIDVAAVD